MTIRTGDKRYICSFVKEIDGVFKPNVVVIEAPNNIIARVKLCEKHGVLNVPIDKRYQDIYKEEGIKDVRLSETNTYVGGQGDDDDFSDDS